MLSEGGKGGVEEESADGARSGEEDAAVGVLEDVSPEEDDGNSVVDVVASGDGAGVGAEGEDPELVEGDGEGITIVEDAVNTFASFTASEIQLKRILTGAGWSRMMVNSFVLFLVIR